MKSGVLARPGREEESDSMMERKTQKKVKEREAERV